MIKKIFKDWLNKKLIINVHISYEIEQPNIVRKENKIVNVDTITYKKSDFRFSRHDILEDGETRTYFFTEKFNGTYWTQVNGSWMSDKEQALSVFTKILTDQKYQTKETKNTVLIEGLNNDEMLTWAFLNGAK